MEEHTVDNKTKRSIKNDLWRLLKWGSFLWVGGMVAVMVLIGVIMVGANTSEPDPAAPTTSTGLQLPADASPAIKTTIETAWPKVLRACPGLDRYSGDLEYLGTEDNFAYAPSTDQRITVLVRVADNPAKVPAAYMAHGHTCHFEIPTHGRTLTIAKRPCVALCRDDAAMLDNQPETVIGLR